eukprot:CAMPEP_0119105186 /NCGR_PEP_ID=MMETSP1180-20130426/3223_1 /TAXON_ID=3052 ORGANISM="Chlamydomonas cf sp, Strain CCMP681" /NCGR_SAMPLE_ID=MMETSP1180 /ASSEMBLY_ACC=CAM_ASM_000741 /LENGTH=45 /DNA_ID= /DNA_START= /DNA_END= /DNA_ORIENTATION=
MKLKQELACPIWSGHLPMLDGASSAHTRLCQLCTQILRQYLDVIK